MSRRHARKRAAAPGLVSLLVIALAPFVGALGGPAAGAAGSGSTGAPYYYVAIGASQTLSFQGVGPNGATRPTTQGYTDDVVAIEAARWPGLQIVPFACPGIRVDIALSGGQTASLPQSLQHLASDPVSGGCRRPAGSEVGTASAFIRAHPGHVVLVTLDLGYTDVAACMVGEAIDSGCVADALTRVRAALPVVVARLRAAGGPSLEIVGLGHEDPSLATYLGANPNPAFAEATARVTEQFNRVVNAAYASVGVRVAQVGAAFATSDTTPTNGGEWGTVPVNVDRICTLTWMCAVGNIHPNVEGYQVMAAAIAAAAADTATTAVRRSPTVEQAGEPWLQSSAALWPLGRVRVLALRP